MTWLFITLISYLIFTVVFLADKYLLTRAQVYPALYTVYIGALGLLAALFIPFTGFSLPGFPQTVLALSAGAALIFGVYWNFEGLRKYEPSRIVPAMGGFVSLFSLLFVLFFSHGKELLSFLQLAAFIFLVGGSVLITWERGKGVTFHSMRIAAVGAFFFALFFVLSKYVYQEQHFWSGFILMRAGGFLAALFFFAFNKEVRQKLFQKTPPAPNVTFWGRFSVSGLIIIAQTVGAGASILQSFAVFLAPFALVPLVNALQGTQYALLLIFTTAISLKWPHIIKEEISKEILLQKGFAILCIVSGVAIIALT